MLSRNSVSPAISLFSAGIQIEMLPWVCPGVWRMWNSASPRRELVALARLAVDLGPRRGLHSQPGGLGIQVGVELGVVLVHVHGRAGERLQLGRAADVVDMGVGDHDGLHREPVPVQDFGDVRDIIAWIDDNGLAGLLVAENRAVALQHADRKNLVNHYHDCILGVWMGRGITLWSINHSVQSLLP